MECMNLMREVKTLEDKLVEIRVRCYDDERDDVKFNLVNVLITFYNTHKNLMDAYKSYLAYLNEELVKYTVK